MKTFFIAVIAAVTLTLFAGTVSAGHFNFKNILGVWNCEQRLNPGTVDEIQDYFVEVFHPDGTDIFFDTALASQSLPSVTTPPGFPQGVYATILMGKFKYTSGNTVNRAATFLLSTKLDAFYQCDAIVNQHLTKPIQQKNIIVHLLLITGVYQLLHTRIPDHAVINETVNSVRELNENWAIKLVNAVLRNYLRDKDNIEKAAAQDEKGEYSHPDWIINTIKKAHPKHYSAILNANNERPPYFLRINQQKTTRNDYLTLLKEKGISAQIVENTPEAILLDEAIPVKKLPGFKEGLVSVQDAAAQQAAHWLELKPGQRVLDACAAPGGKTCHILELEPELQEVIAIDKDKIRIKKISENLTRLTLNAKVIAANANKPKTWWNNKKFDRILIDAPCSGTGVIRRHPDIKLLRRETDIEPLTNGQMKLLTTLWPLLKKDGILVYSTCSILPAENQELIRAFLKNAPTAHLVKEQQIFPGENHMDGFYLARVLFQ